MMNHVESNYNNLVQSRMRIKQHLALLTEVKPRDTENSGDRTKNTSSQAILQVLNKLISIQTYLAEKTVNLLPKQCVINICHSLQTDSLVQLWPITCNCCSCAHSHEEWSLTFWVRSLLILPTNKIDHLPRLQPVWLSGCLCFQPC